MAVLAGLSIWPDAGFMSAQASATMAAAFHMALKNGASITRLAVYGAFLAASAAMFAYFYPVHPEP
ncbi:MAG: hypothetical protein AAGH48_10265 [Pseudomonadota bacterium]